MVRKIDLLTTHQGYWYLSCEGVCSQGTFEAKVWQQARVLYESIQAYQVIEATITATSRGYQLTEIDPFLEDEDPWDYLPRGPGNEEEAWNNLVETLHQSVTEEPWKQLLEFLLSDEEFCWRYQRSPASLFIHHPWRGGLVQHVLSLLKLAPPLCEIYRADLDVVALGLWLHDVGKIWEIDPVKGRYTPEGELVGHLTLGVSWLSGKMLEAGFPETQRNELLHCLVSHHGDLEKGSPRPPMSAAALLVHTLDRLDSEMYQLHHQLVGVEEGEFSEWSSLMKRKFYRSSTVQLPYNSRDHERRDISI